MTREKGEQIIRQMKAERWNTGCEKVHEEGQEDGGNQGIERRTNPKEGV